MNAVLARGRAVGMSAQGWWQHRGDVERDAILYGGSAVFALGMGLFSTQLAQARWGYLVAAVYGVVALGLWLKRRASTAISLRLAALVLVILGAVVVPLGLEARWRNLDSASFAQPEVSVIERSGAYLAQGENPYRVYWSHGHLVGELKNLPAFESFFPYFPLMGVFGLPQAETHKSHGLTDARIVMSLVTLLVSGLALGLLELETRKKIRVAQFLLALPTGALFLATGGDDMPILALLLLAVVALQRRTTWLAGASLGIAAAMKLTAWPLAVGSLLVARDGRGRSSWKTIAWWVLAIVGVTVTPFALRNPRAFLANVFEFPLGLAHVASPAASDLPGHLLTLLWAPLGHVLSPLVFLFGGWLLARDIRAHWPLTLPRLLGQLALFSAALTCAASATRFGYVIYPLNFWLWSRQLHDAELAPADDAVALSA